ncbi:ABC transporter permease subunit [Haloarcula marina]|uniref:ABC transporter permease subunit n=1 Tax=Haloarcula marina TaxID=2961574 RepID=UPI0020B7AFBA|nr:ABC transporter permease subunit [Halomicroarcula marina]
MSQIGKRVAQSLFTIWAVITLTFVMIRQIPGGPLDYVRAQMAMSGADPSEVQAIAEVYLSYEPDGPLTTQYVNYLSQVLQGNLGRSFWFGEPVSDIIGEALPWTLLVMTSSMILTFTIGILLGAIMAYKQGSRFDSATTVISIFFNSVPYYVAALVMLYILGYQYSLFPTSGVMSPSMEVGLTVAFILDILHHAALPVMSFAITAIGGVAIGMRGNSISILGADYLRVARLRGLPTRRIATRYVLRNSLLPMYTHFLIAIGFMFGGSVILERIFVYQGIGFYLFEAINATDYSLMMGAFLVITIAVTTSIFVADITYGFIDPRAGSSNERSKRSTLDILRALRKSLRLRFSSHSISTPEDGRGGKGTAQGYGTGNDESESVFQTVAATDPGESATVKRFFEEGKQMAKTLWADRRARIGLLIIGTYVFLGTVGISLVESPRIGQGPRLLPPFQSLAYPFGTNAQSQDLFALTIYSISPMLQMIVAGAVVATVLATIVGTVSGYVGGIIDRFLMTISDTMIAIPGLPLLIVVAAILKPQEPWFIGVVLSIPMWAGLARKIRSEVLKLRRVAYVESSEIIGVSSQSIILRDILPNLMSFISVNFAYNARSIIFSSVGLYFLGVLPTAQVRNWGVMLNIGFQNGALYNTERVYLVLIPMMAIVLLTLAMVLLAQGMDRMFNPRIRAKGESDEEGVEEKDDSSTVVTESV